MKWRCALLQRWLPEYPDGDLPAFWKARLSNHLKHCIDCRQELSALGEVAKAVRAASVPDPGQEFWAEFSREMHLKLAQAARDLPAQSPMAFLSWRRWPYAIGIPALAVLLLWVAVQFDGPGTPVRQASRVSQAEAPKVAEPAKVAVAPQPSAPAASEGFEQFVQVTLVEEENPAGEGEEVDLSGWDLDAEVAGMSDQEKESFLKTLHQHEKDGSWVVRFSSYSWA